MPQPLSVLVIFAHPDEGEIYAGGTAALLAQAGHRVKFLSLTNGDAGHWSMAPKALAERRYQEAMESLRILGLADYEIFPEHDGQLANTPEIRQRVAACIRDWQADLVFTFYPITSVEGGHTDNTQAGLIVRQTAEALSLENLPAFFYLRDYFTLNFSYLPDLALSIDSVWDLKLKALAAHVSQVAEANPYAEGLLEEIQEDEQQRQVYLYRHAARFSRVTPDIRLTLQKWYGLEAAAQIDWAEAFEVAEFGRALDNQQITALFHLPGSPTLLEPRDSRP